MQFFGADSPDLATRRRFTRHLRAGFKQGYSRDSSSTRYASCSAAIASPDIQQGFRSRRNSCRNLLLDASQIRGPCFAEMRVVGRQPIVGRDRIINHSSSAVRTTWDAGRALGFQSTRSWRRSPLLDSNRLNLFDVNEVRWIHTGVAGGAVSRLLAVVAGLLESVERKIG